MNVSCVICADRLTPTDDIFYTPCGHVFHFVCITQWLERSKTCPQCRERVTANKIHRIFFNFNNNESISEDPTSLQARIDSLKFELHVKEREIKDIGAKYDKCKHESSGLRKEVRKLENDLVSKDTAVLALKDQIKYFKNQSSDAEDAKKEVARLKKKLDEFRSVQILINAPSEDVDEMIVNTTDPCRLATYISVLKKELTSSVARRKQLRSMMTKAQQDLTDVSMERNFLLGEHEKRKELEELVLSLTNQNSQLESRIKELENALTDEQKEMISKSEISLPVANTESKKASIKTAKKAGCGSSSSKTSDIIDLTNDTPERLKTKHNLKRVLPDLTESEKKENTPSFGSKYNIVTGAMQKKKSNLVSEKSQYWMLAKKPRLAESAKAGQSTSEMTFDGFGGHSKNDVFPEPKQCRNVKKPATSTIKKGKLDDGNNKKIGDYAVSDPSKSFIL